MKKLSSEVQDGKHTFQLKSGSSPQCGFYIAGHGSCHRLASDEIHSLQDVDRCVKCGHEQYNGVCLIPGEGCDCKCEFPSPSVSEAAPERIWIIADPNDALYRTWFPTGNVRGNEIQYARVHQPSEQNSEDKN